MCHTNSNSNLTPSDSQQPNTEQDLVTCAACGGQNHARTMTYNPIAGGYLCEFCLLDETESIPFVVVEPDLSQMDEIDLAQRFVDLHHSGDKPAARPYLAELIRRNELQQGLQALAEKQAEEVTRG